MIGRIPPPVGGVTIHTIRLIEYLSKIEGCHVKHIDVGVFHLALFAFDCLRFKNRNKIVHCQLSSVYGLGIVAIILLLTFSRAKLVYSLHSEYWVGRNINKNRFRSLLSKFFLRRTNLVIADNARIAKDIGPYVTKVQVFTPFLPPQGELGEESLSDYLGLPAFDSQVLVFNAYKLVYTEDGRDIYGLDVLLNAYLKLDVSATLIILIPTLQADQLEAVKEIIKSSPVGVNKERIHIISSSLLEGWKVIAKSDIFIRPTITDGDALSVREALYFGIPTIVSDCTVRPDGVVLFKTGDSQDLCEAISCILKKNESVERGSSGDNVTEDYYGRYSDLFYGFYE